MMNAMARGEHIRVVASRGVLSAGGCVTNGFVARPDLAAKLDAMSAQELKGLTFGVDPTWLDSFFLQQWLGERGLTLDDVGTKYLPAIPPGSRSPAAGRAGRGLHGRALDHAHRRRRDRGGLEIGGRHGSGLPAERGDLRAAMLGR
jgi:hypothetical protein